MLRDVHLGVVPWILPALAGYAVEHVGSPPSGCDLRIRVPFQQVVGLQLGDSHEVVVKVSVPGWPGITACIEVRRHMFQAGSACPPPLTSITPFDDDVAGPRSLAYQRRHAPERGARGPGLRWKTWDG